MYKERKLGDYILITDTDIEFRLGEIQPLLVKQIKLYRSLGYSVYDITRLMNVSRDMVYTASYKKLALPES